MAVHAVQMDKKAIKEKLFHPVTIFMMGLGVRFAMDLLAEYILEQKKRRKKCH